jgi:hypothetical protein
MAANPRQHCAWWYLYTRASSAVPGSPCPDRLLPGMCNKMLDSGIANVFTKIWKTANGIPLEAPHAQLQAQRRLTLAELPAGTQSHPIPVPEEAPETLIGPGVTVAHGAGPTPSAN